MNIALRYNGELAASRNMAAAAGDLANLGLRTSDLRPQTSDLRPSDIVSSFRLCF